MAQPFDSQQDLNSRHLESIIESTSVPGQGAQAVCNPDGSDIGGGGGGAVDQGNPALDANAWPVKIRDSGNLAINNGQQTMTNSVPVVIASNQTAIPVSISGSATALTPGSGQVVVAAGPVATPLAGAPTQVDQVNIIAKLSNLSSIFIGGAAVTLISGMELEPGRGVSLQSVDLAAVFIIGTAGEGISFFSLT